MQSTHHFLGILKQELGMSIQAWHTLVRVEYKKCNFPSVAEDRLQRDIFVIGLNDSFRRFRSDIISREDLILRRAFKLTVITQQHLEEAANKVTPARNKPNEPKWLYRPE